MNDIPVLPDVKLRFNIQYPNLEECYSDGYECALTDVTEEANPYREATQEHEHWLEGWWAGFYGKQPIFELAELMVEPEQNSYQAANDHQYHALGQTDSVHFIIKVLKITGAIVAVALVGYQMLDLVG